MYWEKNWIIFNIFIFGLQGIPGSKIYTYFFCIEKYFFVQYFLYEKRTSFV